MTLLLFIVCEWKNEAGKLMNFCGKMSLSWDFQRSRSQWINIIERRTFGCILWFRKIVANAYAIQFPLSPLLSSYSLWWWRSSSSSPSSLSPLSCKSIAFLIRYHANIKYFIQSDFVIATVSFTVFYPLYMILCVYLHKVHIHI